MEPDFHLDDGPLLWAFVNFYVIQLDAKIFHLHAQVINDVQKLAINPVNYLEYVGYKQDRNAVCEYDENRDVLFVDIDFAKWHLDVHRLATNY